LSLADCTLELPLKVIEAMVVAALFPFVGHACRAAVAAAAVM
jgi:hypothetical protein